MFIFLDCLLAWFRTHQKPKIVQILVMPFLCTHMLQIQKFNAPHSGVHTHNHSLKHLSKAIVVRHINFFGLVGIGRGFQQILGVLNAIA